MMGAKRRVLYICHNHPSVRPGGVEAYALELYEGMRASSDFEPLLLARIGPPMTDLPPPHGGTPFSLVDGDPNQYFFYTDPAGFDWFYGTLRDKTVYIRDFKEFLLAWQPDIVHFQHTLYLGYDLIRQIRSTLPLARIVYTLQELLPICHRHGQMIRAEGDELCYSASPPECHECFPDISPQSFFLRKRFIHSHLSLVDLFLAPSRFLLERFVEWGIPREKIRHEEYGRQITHHPRGSEVTRPRNQIGYFGQFSAHKGVNILLQAMKILQEDASDLHLWLHGANLSLQPGTFQEEFHALLDEVSDLVTLVGRYDHDELPGLMERVDWMVVPSIWWENSPLVIQEAFQYGKPVICSDIGGMAEKVTHGVNGLHFRVRDPASLADMIHQAVTTPGLWEILSSGIPDVYRMEDHVEALSEMYRALLAGSEVMVR
jgi:glycosyltransferase involved in cell wall biosynthesis